MNEPIWFHKSQIRQYGYFPHYDVSTFNFLNTSNITVESKHCKRNKEDRRDKEIRLSDSDQGARLKVKNMRQRVRNKIKEQVTSQEQSTRKQDQNVNRGQARKVQESGKRYRGIGRFRDNGWRSKLVGVSWINRPLFDYPDFLNIFSCLPSQQTLPSTAFFIKRGGYQ